MLVRHLYLCMIEIFRSQDFSEEDRESSPRLRGAYLLLTKAVSTALTPINITPAYHN